MGEDYDGYEESLYFEGSFQGENIISEARIHDNGDIHFHQGPKTDDGKYRLDDIVGFGLEELKQVVEKAEEITEDDSELETTEKRVEDLEVIRDDVRELQKSIDDDPQQLSQFELASTLESLDDSMYKLWQDIQDRREEVISDRED